MLVARSSTTIVAKQMAEKLGNHCCCRAARHPHCGCRDGNHTCLASRQPHCGCGASRLAVEMIGNHSVVVEPQCGERSKEQEEKNDKWHRVERSSGKFLRRFRMPENAKTDQVKASMENGVLTVIVPKEEVKKPESIRASKLQYDDPPSLTAFLASFAIFSALSKNSSFLSSIISLTTFSIISLSQVASTSSKGNTVTQSNINHASESLIQAREEAHYHMFNYSQDAQYQPHLPGYGDNLVPTYGSSHPFMSMNPLVRQLEEQMLRNLLANPTFHLPHNQYDR
ncbi:Heat shock protein 1 [Forsythia ovata]|uniref:Heat shock protein 1 n=1 Tax=Forsythia ovata TaxID=205694 RepID=A0ABD1WGI5_9LAMI